jgi:hypothetical protein
VSVVALAGAVAPERRGLASHGQISRTLLTVRRGLRGDRVTIGTIVDRLGADGLGLALLVLTLPTLIPIPGPFGITFGTLLALLALQTMAGARSLWLPGPLRRVSAPSDAIRAVIARALPWVARAETVLQERRLAVLAGPRARPVLAVPVLLLAFAIILPIPLGNMAPAIALLAFALGFMARDGLAILAALGLSAAALAWTGLLVFAGASALEWVTRAFGA